MDTLTNCRGVLTGNKVSELHDEAFNEFSDAPFDFETTAHTLWSDTQKVYYHACTANRFSENYLLYCTQLEKNIKQLGSFCLTKAVLEQKGIDLPKLKDMSIHDLVCMVSFHLRKAHAALDGIYQDNNILGITYLNWEIRWAGLGNRLKATEVKIQKIREGKLNVDSMLEQTETFKGAARTNTHLSEPKSLRVNPNAMPIKGSVARDMLKTAKAEEKQAERIRKARERKLETAGRLERQADRLMGFGPPRAYGPSREGTILMNRESAAQLRKEVEEEIRAEREAKLKPEPECPPGMISEGEARRILIEKAIKEGDQAAVLAIQQEDGPQFRARWDRYIETLKKEKAIKEAAARGPSQETRKALREKRKKRK